MTEYAFPSLFAAPEGKTGMTLRDYFAAKAMEGFVAHYTWDSIRDLAEGVLGGAIVSQAAYAQADAMLKERAK